MQESRPARPDAQATRAPLTTVRRECAAFGRAYWYVLDMTGSPRMAAAQTAPRAGDVEANLRQHLQLIELAAAHGVTLLAFPELSLTGYELALAPELAFDADDARLRPLIDAARAHDMVLGVGAPLRVPSALHIAAFIIEPTGRLQVYTKHHLGAFRPEHYPDAPVPPPEPTFFAPGTSNPSIEWRGRKLALSICADSLYPSHTDAAGERAADVYISCQFAIEAHLQFKMSRLTAAARRHGYSAIFSNYGGPTGGLPSAGRSCILSSEGECVARLPAQGCGIAFAWRDDTWGGESVLLGA